jgi:hypothetical protein
MFKSLSIQSMTRVQIIALWLPTHVYTQTYGIFNVKF